MLGICATGTIEEGIGKLQKQQIMVPLGVGEKAEMCNSFVIVPNDIVCLYLDHTWLNQALTRPIHRGPIIDNILSELTNVHCVA